MVTIESILYLFCGPPASEERNMALYVLLAVLVALVVYLFYAVIHPERF